MTVEAFAYLLRTHKTTTTDSSVTFQLYCRALAPKNPHCAGADGLHERLRSLTRFCTSRAPEWPKGAPARVLAPVPPRDVPGQGKQNTGELFFGCWSSAAVRTKFEVLSDLVWSVVETPERAFLAASSMCLQDCRLASTS